MADHGAEGGGAGAGSEELQRKRPRQAQGQDSEVAVTVRCSATAASSSAAPAPPAASSTGPPGHPPQKRRRLGEASVLCMRELFRAVVKDGDITEAERLVLQNTALLLAQVDGKTWVNFTDTQGELKDFTPQQLKLLRPFLEKVAKELKEHEMTVTSLDANSKEVIDCLRLADVPWADGITARELLGCCSPNEEILWPNRAAQQVVSRLPSRYMLQSRVRELINHYYLRRAAAEVARAHGARGGTAAGAPFYRRAPLALFSLCGRVVAPCARCCRKAGGAIFGNAATAVAWLVVAAAAAVVTVLSAAWHAVVPSALRWGSQEPFWPAMRFFGAALLHGQTREIFKFLVMIARLRVFVCLASCNTFFGYLFYPLVVVVEKVLKLERGNRLLGCTCHDSGDPSLLSWLPVKASNGVVWLLKLARFIPLADFATEPFVRFVDLSHPFLSFLFDLTFSLGLAQGLALVVDLADEKAQQRLVWMSMGIARMLREGPKEASQTPEAPAAGLVAPGPHTISVAAAATTVAVVEAQSVPMEVEGAPAPAWSEDGSWSLFESS